MCETKHGTPEHYKGIHQGHRSNFPGITSCSTGEKVRRFVLIPPEHGPVNTPNNAPARSGHFPSFRHCLRVHVVLPQMIPVRSDQAAKGTFPLAHYLNYITNIPRLAKSLNEHPAARRCATKHGFDQSPAYVRARAHTLLYSSSRVMLYRSWFHSKR
ncbi:hypothetical protein BJV77DRAFT_680257 [Russula vinacea]|nr:hypothetical protein BJV77DRAFT_680257 [Russula vinacea]